MINEKHVMIDIETMSTEKKCCNSTDCSSLL
jgi:hypothetical protein